MFFDSEQVRHMYQDSFDADVTARYQVRWLEHYLKTWEIHIQFIPVPKTLRALSKLHVERLYQFLHSLSMKGI